MPIPEVNLNNIAAFKYEGGKATIRYWLARWIPGKGRAYVEPFAGRGHVFFLMGNICSYQMWHLNDMRTGQPGAFLNALMDVDIADIPLHVHKNEEDYWKEQRAKGTPIGALMEALLTHNSMHYDSTASFQGSGHICHGDVKDGIYGNYTREGLSSRVLQAKEVMQKTAVNISALDYTKLPWDKYTSKDFIYLDPPYLGAITQCYNENDINPEQMVHILKGTRARWLLSEYEQDIYNKAFGKPAVEYNTVQIVTKTHSKPYRKEVLYANFPLKFRPIKFIRSSEALQSTLDKLRSMGSMGLSKDNMERWLDGQGTPAGKIKAELVNLKYHSHVLYNGLKYWWMGK